MHLTTHIDIQQLGQDINESTIRIFNQIDYIICEKRHKNLLTNARSYAGTLTNSNHRLIKTTFRVEKHKLWNRKSNTPKPPKLNISKLTNSKTCRDQYRIKLNYRLTQIDQDNDTVCNTWANIRSAIKNSAKASVGTIVRNKQKRTPNDTISELSKRQKDIRLQIQNTDNRERKVELKKERNRVLHTIKKLNLRKEIKN